MPAALKKHSFEPLEFVSKPTDKLEEAMLEMGVEKIEPISIFSEGVYVRKVFMPAGTPLVLGHEHKTRHLNVVVSGKALVSMNEAEPIMVHAGDVFESEAGVRKALYILEDMEWMTIHPNPEELRTEEDIEDKFIHKSDGYKEYASSKLLNTVQAIEETTV